MPNECQTKHKNSADQLIVLCKNKRTKFNQISQLNFIHKRETGWKSFSFPHNIQSQMRTNTHIIFIFLQRKLNPSFWRLENDFLTIKSCETVFKYYRVIYFILVFFCVYLASYDLRRSYYTHVIR